MPDAPAAWPAHSRRSLTQAHVGPGTLPQFAVAPGSLGCDVPRLAPRYVSSGPPAGARANLMALENDAMEIGVNLVLYRRHGR